MYANTLPAHNEHNAKPQMLQENYTNFHLITDLSLAHDAFTAHLFMQEQCNQHLIKTIQYLFNCCTHQKLAEKVNTRVTLINS